MLFSKNCFKKNDFLGRYNLKTLQDKKGFVMYFSIENLILHLEIKKMHFSPLVKKYDFSLEKLATLPNEFFPACAIAQNMPFLTSETNSKMRFCTIFFRATQYFCVKNELKKIYFFESPRQYLPHFRRHQFDNKIHSQDTDCLKFLSEVSKLLICCCTYFRVFLSFGGICVKMSNGHLSDLRNALLFRLNLFCVQMIEIRNLVTAACF